MNRIQAKAAEIIQQKAAEGFTLTSKQTACTGSIYLEFTGPRVVKARDFGTGRRVMNPEKFAAEHLPENAYDVRFEGWTAKGKATVSWKVDTESEQTWSCRVSDHSGTHWRTSNPVTGVDTEVVI